MATTSLLVYISRKNHMGSCPPQLPGKENHGKEE
nr:MAG TPA: hypothetical protein [Caudoviricetes sp.]